MTPLIQPVLSLVVPCFNEEALLDVTANVLSSVLVELYEARHIGQQSKIYFIDDGSTDGTWCKITELAKSSDLFVGIKLTRNFGHQYALYAGLMEAAGDVIVSLDADLQDDVTIISEMIIKYSAGYDVVYGVRSDRREDSYFKRWTAYMHYGLSKFMGVETVHNHADFRLLSRRAISALSEYREANLYLRGIIPLLGMASTEVEYERKKRFAGTSKYNIRRMFGLSIRGITSFSVMPLRFISALGIIVFTSSLIMGGWALNAVLSGNTSAAGWASTVIPIYLLGGLQLLSIGIAGEYIGKTYMEVKKRPLYSVDEIYDKDTDS
jgi:glycosyltransferase involved in cell wall biosynthesis